MKRTNALWIHVSILRFACRSASLAGNRQALLKFSVVAALVLGSLLASISVLPSSASAQNSSAPPTRTEKIRALQVENLNAYQGKFLTVLYAIGSKPVLSTDNRQTELTEIRAVHSVPIQNGRAMIPSVSLPIVGFRPAYNFVMFVVHEQRDFVWTNSTSLPRDPRGLVANESNTLSLRVAALTKSGLERIAVEQPNSAALLLSF
jgi:hypothetical protein